jgi:hypothetical protein
MASVSFDLSELLKGIPAGAWVAISERSNSVLAYAADVQTVVGLARSQGETDPLVVRVPEQASALFL